MKLIPNSDLIELDSVAPFYCRLCDWEWNIEDGELVDEHLIRDHGLRYDEWANGDFWTQKQRVLR